MKQDLRAHGVPSNGRRVPFVARPMQLPQGMQTPVGVMFHNLPRSEAVEVAIERWVSRLEHLHVQLLHCQVWIDLAHHHGHDPRYRIRLAIGVPGTEITVSHESGNADIYVAITEAFVAARRQLEEHVRPRRASLSTCAI